MADNVIVDNGALSDYSVSSDETPSGQVQRVKLAYSADGSDAPVPADANGLLVSVSKNPGSTAGTQSAVVVGTAATLLAGALATRKSLNLTPMTGTVYIGYTNAVTTATGFPVAVGQTWEEPDFKGGMYAVCASGTINVRVLEVQ